MAPAKATCLPEHADRPKVSSKGECNSCYSRRKFQENPHLRVARQRREKERYLEKQQPKMLEPIPCVECRTGFIRRVWKQKTCDDCRTKLTETLKWRDCDRCGNVFFRKSNSQKHCIDCSEAIEQERDHNGAVRREKTEARPRRPKVATKPVVKTLLRVQPKPQVISKPEPPELPPFRPLPKTTVDTSGLKWAHRKFDPDVVRSMTADPLWGWHDD